MNPIEMFVFGSASLFLGVVGLIFSLTTIMAADVKENLPWKFTIKVIAVSAGLTVLGLWLAFPIPPEILDMAK